MSQRFVRRGGSCLLEILIAGVLIILGFFAVFKGWVSVRHRARCAHTQAVLSSLSTSIALYKADWSVVPAGANADLMRALTTADRRGPYFTPSHQKLSGKGELLDVWGNPFQYVGEGRSGRKLYSCGPNGKDEGGGGDDISAP